MSYQQIAISHCQRLLKVTISPYYNDEDELKSLSDGIKVIFIDLYPNFCGSDGKLYAKYTSDGVHPNSDGYAIFKSLESQYIN